MFQLMPGQPCLEHCAQLTQHTPAQLHMVDTAHWLMTAAGRAAPPTWAISKPLPYPSSRLLAGTTTLLNDTCTPERTHSIG